MFEARLIYQKAEELRKVAASKPANRVKTAEMSKKARKELKKTLPEDASEKVRLDPVLQPAAVIRNLDEEILDHMNDYVDGKEQKVEEKHLVSLAQAALATQFRIPDPQFRKELNHYLSSVKTDLALTAGDKKTETRLRELYVGIARYNVRYEAVRGDTKGQIESLYESAKDTGLSGVKKILDTYAGANRFEKIAAAGLATVLGLWVMVGKSDTASNIRKTLVILAGGVAAFLTANTVSKWVSDKPVIKHIDGWNATSDTDSLQSYFDIKGEDADDTAQTLLEAADFDKKTSNMKAKTLFAKHKAAKSSKELKLSDDLDPKHLYLGVGAFSRRLDLLRTKNPAVHKDLAMAISKGASFNEVFLMMMALDKDAWHIDNYHTRIGGEVASLFMNDLDRDFTGYLRDDGNKALMNKWLKTTSMYPSARKAGATEFWWTAKFGHKFNKQTELRKTGRGEIINECLNSKKTLSGAGGKTYMAVSVKIQDKDVPKDYVKRAYDELVKKYKLGKKSKGGIEPLVGAVIEQNNEYVLLVEKGPSKSYNPIV